MAEDTLDNVPVINLKKVGADIECAVEFDFWVVG